MVYGGLIGPLIDAHATLEQAETTHSERDPEVVLVVLGPDQEGEQGQKVVCSERDSSGRWKRLAIGPPPSS